MHIRCGLFIRIFNSDVVKFDCLSNKNEIWFLLTADDALTSAPFSNNSLAISEEPLHEAYQRGVRSTFNENM